MYIRVGKRVEVEVIYLVRGKVGGVGSSGNLIFLFFFSEKSTGVCTYRYASVCG